MKNWKTYKLSEVANIKGGKRLPKGNMLTPFKNEHPYIRVTDMGKGRFIPMNQLLYVPDDVFPSIKNYITNTNDVLLSIVGTIGSVAKVDEKLDNASLTENCVKLKPTPNLNSDFLYYFLTSPKGKEEITKGIVGSTQPKLPLYNIEKIEFPLPDIDTQQSIASILSSLDDKIELNLQMNQTLEAIAQAIFKEWCSSDLNKIPEDWSLKKLSEIAEISSSKRIFMEEYVKNGVPFYRGKEVTQLSKGENISTELFISFERYDDIKSKFGVPSVGDILITSVGTIGSVWLVDDDSPFYFKDGNVTWVKNYKTDITGDFIYQWLQTIEAQNQIKSATIGSTQQALTISALKGLEVLVPNRERLLKAIEQLKLINLKRTTNLKQINILTQLRDTLLPKLMSGQISLNTI